MGYSTESSRAEEAYLVYLAGPIQGVSREGARAWRREFAASLLAEEGEDSRIVIFDPTAAFSAVSETPEIRAVAQKIDDFAVLKASVVVVHHVPDVTSPGTDHEIAIATLMDTPIVVFGADAGAALLRIVAVIDALGVKDHPPIIARPSLGAAVIAVSALIKRKRHLKERS